MRHLVIFLIVSGMAALITVPQSSAFFAQNREKSDELRERDEIRQTLPLTPGTRVEVSSIRGAVEIETADIGVAEIYIVRSAQSRSDLEQYKIGIENKPQSLTIRGEQRERNSGAGYGPDVLHRVMLRLPRRIDLSVHSVSGQVRIGDVNGQVVVSGVGDAHGQVQVSSVSGVVTIGQVNQQVEVEGVGGNVRIEHVSGSLNVSGVSGEVWIGDVSGKLIINSVGGSVITGALGGPVQIKGVSGGVTVDRITGQTELRSVGGNVKIGQIEDSLDASGVAGTVSVGIAKLGYRGVQIKSISGQVELRFKGGLNAQLSTDNISGKLSIDLPNVTIQSKPNATAVRAVIGEGGVTISINGVGKDVRLAPQRK